MSQSDILYTFWEEGSLCDVQCRTSDGSLVPAHKIILAAASPFFRALFIGSGQSMREGSNTSIIDLPGIDETDLRAILQVVYTNSSNSLTAPATNDDEQEQQEEVDPDSIVTLLASASYLGFTSVREACSAYLKRALAIETVAETLVLAHTYDCASLKSDALRFLQYQFTLLLQCPAVNTLQVLPIDLLIELLSSNELEISNENEVLAAIAIWMIENKERASSAPKLISNTVRAVLTDQDCVKAVDMAVSSLHPPPEQDVIATTRGAMIAAVNEIQIRNSCAAGRSLNEPSSNNNMSFQKRQGSLSSLLVLGGVTDGWLSLKINEIYDPRKDEWMPGSSMLSSCSFAAAATLGNGVYAIEGVAHQPVVQYFDRKKQFWSYLPPPSTCRVNMAATALPNLGFFVLGGKMGSGRAGTSLNSVDRLSLERQWDSDTAPMQVPRASLAACSLNNQHIFAIGGQNDRHTYDSAEFYDPGKNEWFNIGSKMAYPRKYLSAASINGQVMAIGGMTGARKKLAQVEAYDPREGIWRQNFPPMSVPRSSAGVAVLHGEVFIAGGNVGDSGGVSNSVECFNMAAGKWRTCASLALARSGLALAPI